VTDTGEGETDAAVTAAAVAPGTDAMFRTIVQTSVNPYVVLDPDGEIVWCSDRVEALLGHPAAWAIGRHFLDIIHPSSHEAVVAEYARFMEEHGRRPWVGPPMLLDLTHADGSRITCEVSAATAASHGMPGVIVQVRRWRGTVLLYAAVDALAAGEPLDGVLAKIGAIVEHDVPGAIVFVAAGWNGHRFDVVASAPGTEPTHRRLAADIAELPVEEWCRDESEAHDLAALLEGSGLVSCWSIPVTVRGDVHPTAAVFLSGSTPIPPPIPSTTIERVAKLVALAIESDHNRRAWRRSATTDHLTDLPNRGGLDEWLTRRSGVHRAADIAVLFCDLDEFKQVNDRLGHAIGDRTLRVVAERLRRTVRDGDFVCRWGGDEFVVVCTDPSAAEALASRLIAQMQEPIGLGDRQPEVGLSIGITYGTTISPLDDLLRESDRALLEAKAAGRNRYVVRG
jgi:diguanylate cyclase (GGDEF)-like protein/PAS domain S-box-containing protein